MELPNEILHHTELMTIRIFKDDEGPKSALMATSGGHGVNTKILIEAAAIVMNSFIRAMIEIERSNGNAPPNDLAATTVLLAEIMKRTIDLADRAGSADSPINHAFKIYEPQTPRTPNEGDRQ